jgi:hypothetical protein
MPRLNHAIQYSVFYLYKRHELTGKLIGPLGTGFFMNRQSTEVPPFSHIYAVTNWHVANRDNASVIRCAYRRSRPPVPIDRDQCGAGADGAVG